LVVEKVIKSFGIDFGTTNSSVTRYMSTRLRSELTPYDEEKRPIPSVVAIDKQTGQVHTGLDAWSRRAELQDTCRCIASVKSLLEDEGWGEEIAGHEWTAKEIACEVFQKLRQSVSERGEHFDTATLAIPVGLAPAARATLREAAQYAGIRIESMVSEPTAAFFAYYNELRGSERVAVFDWGGGTLDVSILRHTRGAITELATKGLDQAGDYIDRELATRIHSMVVREKGESVLFDEMEPRFQDSILVVCERAKRDFSDNDEYVVFVPKYGDMGFFRKVITYDWFSGVVSPIVKSAVSCLDDALSEAGLTDAGIDQVILVGGSSNLRPLREKMLRRFGDKLLFPGDKGWSVSIGAAMLSFAPGAYVAAQDVSIILADGTPYYLLRKGTPIKNWRNAVEFGITDASQTLRVVFSGSADIDDSEERFRLCEVKGYGFLEEKLKLEAWVDENLILRVRMKSSMRPDRDAEVWHYDRLKLSYDISGLVS
jgi:molecular chaperone DnaK